jgi:hypothetical protein
MTVTGIDITEKVREYKGTNDFVMKMQNSLKQWGRLTSKQMDVVSKLILNEERQKDVDVDNLPEQFLKIVNYNGESKFVQDIKAKYLQYRTLTEKQLNAANKAIYTEEQKNSQIPMDIKLVGNTIKLGRKIAGEIKKEYKLDFHPILVDVTKITMTSNKAVKLVAKLTKENAGICRCCGKTLTDEMSRMTGLGPICSGYVGVKHPSTKEDLPYYRQLISDKIDEVGEFEFWIPKRGIVEWNGSAGVLLSM